MSYIVTFLLYLSFKFGVLVSTQHCKFVLFWACGNKRSCLLPTTLECFFCLYRLKNLHVEN